MGRINVEYKGQWAEFSTITDAFNTIFDDEETYENYRKQELGRALYHPIDKRTVKTIEEVTDYIRMNRSHDKAIEVLLDAGLDKDDAEKILQNVEARYYHPIPTEDGKYLCPNCKKTVSRRDAQCPACEHELVWR